MSDEIKFQPIEVTDAYYHPVTGERINPMTNQERSEKIVNEYFNGDNGKNTSLYEKILIQLDELERETYQNTISKCSVDKGSFDMGFASAREQAVGIAEETCDATSLPECHRRFAERIRAMQPDGKEDK